jgi:cellulose 1,4-beta-cellobiosidase
MKQAIFFLGLLAAATAQGFGKEIYEVHGNMSWTQCKKLEDCRQVEGEIVLDAEWRWLHNAGGYRNCYDGNRWNSDTCNSVNNCTTCEYEGADLKGTYGIIAKNDSIFLQYKTLQAFSYNINSRVFLMENEDTYQTFTLLNNEVAVDVDLSTVECGIRAGLYFVAMDADGGKSRFPTNKAGARYGTGYCDASCPRSNRFNGGKANSANWIPSETDAYGGWGEYGACCAEFDILASNAHSYLMSSKPCTTPRYEVCHLSSCDPERSPYQYDNPIPLCDKYGCEYQPYRLGHTDFYGRNKTIDTNKKFTVVTQFKTDKVTQFFIQDGKKIEVPTPDLPGLPAQNSINADYCKAKTELYEYRDRWNRVGGYAKHLEMLSQPMVLTMGITNDHWSWNAWLDSQWLPEEEGKPGTERGPCKLEDNDPAETSARYGRATVVWSNLRFGPIGSTVKA